jgi:hypothetical protein
MARGLTVGELVGYWEQLDGGQRRILMTMARMLANRTKAANRTGNAGFADCEQCASESVLCYYKHGERWCKRCIREAHASLDNPRLGKVCNR